MEAKIGDRVSIDAKKVGQPRRTGVITKVTRGLSGVRYQVRWEDGHESVLSPGVGNLSVHAARANAKSGNSKRPAAKAKRPKAKAKRPKAKAKRPKAKAKPKRRKVSRRR